MILVLDSTAYRANSQNGVHFQGLTRLCNHGFIQLKIPFMVEQEAVSQKKHEASKLFAAATNALQKLAGSPSLTSDEAQEVRTFEQSVGKLGESAAYARITETWEYWKEFTRAETIEFTAAHAQAAILAYIEGAPPVHPAKNRNDLPDSFIYQQIRELASADTVTVISGDDGLRKALEGVQNVTVFKRLPEFLESGPSQELFQKLDEKDKEHQRSIVLEFLRSNAEGLVSLLEKEGGDKIVGINLPFDDPSSNPNEHSISGYGEPTGIIIDFEGLQYFGGGEYSLPFEFSSEVLIEFFIDKSEYWTIDEEDQPSVSDWNDYVYHAESQEEVRVHGILKISIPPEVFEELVIDGDKIDISGLDVEIDSIESIERAGGDY
jgi:hypothetical protein